MDYSHTSSIQQSQPSPKRRSKAAFERRCLCPGCRRHIARLEELNAHLARANDALRRECDELTLSLAGKGAA